MRAIAFLLVFLLAVPAVADNAFYEPEPNNTLGRSNPIAGALSISGTMDKGDQDAFMWTVSDDDAQ